MGEQERPGEQGLARSGRVTDDDTTGHRIKFGSPDTDQPPTEAADTEGHLRGRSASEGADEPQRDAADSEGHAAKVKATDDEATDEDAEGHRFKF